MKAFRWLAKYWHIPFLVLGGIVGLVFLGSRRGSQRVIDDELAAIDKGEKARLDAIDRGADIANAEADQQYHNQIKRLDEKQSAKADRLRRDPARRVRYLERLTRKGG